MSISEEFMSVIHMMNISLEEEIRLFWEYVKR